MSKLGTKYVDLGRIFEEKDECFDGETFINKKSESKSDENLYSGNIYGEYGYRKSSDKNYEIDYKLPADDTFTSYSQLITKK